MNKINVGRILLIGFLGIAGLAFFSQCEVGFDCVLVDNMEQYDEENRVQYDSVVIENIVFDPRAVFVNDPDAFNEAIIVNEDSTYNKWKDLSMSCVPCSFPDIDFNTRTLIGKYIELGCNSLPYVFTDKEGDVYKHVVKAINYSRCNYTVCDNFTFAWITVPKMSANETVEFESGTAYYDCDC